MKPSEVKKYEKTLIAFLLFVGLILVQNYRGVAKEGRDRNHDKGQYSAKIDQTRHRSESASRQRKLIGIAEQTNKPANYATEQFRPYQSEFEQSGREYYSRLPHTAIRENHNLTRNHYRTIPEPIDRDENRNHYRGNQNAILGEMVALVRVRVLRGVSASVYTKNRITCHTIIEEKLRHIL